MGDNLLAVWEIIYRQNVKYLPAECDIIYRQNGQLGSIVGSFCDIFLRLLVNIDFFLSRQKLQKRYAYPWK